MFLENLILVPVEELRTRQAGSALRKLNARPMVREQLFGVADQVLAEHHDVVGRADGECAEIEDLVVQRAYSRRVWWIVLRSVHPCVPSAGKFRLT